MYRSDFVEGDVDFDVSNPEAESSVGGDVDTADGVVPEPGYGDEVSYGDGDDGSVGADGDCGDDHGDEDCFEEEEAEFECKRKRSRSETQKHRSIIRDICQRLCNEKRIIRVNHRRRKIHLFDCGDSEYSIVVIVVLGVVLAVIVVVRVVVVGLAHWSPVLDVVRSGWRFT